MSERVPVVVPDELAKRHATTFGDDGRTWTRRLPDVVRTYLAA